MQKFTTLTGIAAHLPMINVDTDMIIPKQYLKTIKRTGLGTGLFAELRYDEQGKPHPHFVLHQPPYTEAKILITGENFGCGSSREHAPWALLDFGISCIIAPSFADIFYNNCFKNGILPIALPQQEIDKLIDASRGPNAVLTIDLEAQEIRGPDGGVIKFDIDPFRKRCLMEGLDDIGLTLEKAEAIESFDQGHPTTPPRAKRQQPHTHKQRSRHKRRLEARTPHFTHPTRPL
jgi:3-isopropylmalate/(R)-2-methylmalate dehydratase small subunit